MDDDHKAQQLRASFIELSKFLQHLAPGQIQGICQFVNPRGSFEINFPLLRNIIQHISLDQIQNLISLASKRFYLQEGYVPESSVTTNQAKTISNTFENETEQFIQFYHIYVLARLLRDLSRQQLMALFDIVPAAIPQIEQLQLLQQIQQILAQLHPETLRNLRDELAESPGNQLQQLISMNILKTEHFNLYRPFAILLTLDSFDLLRMQQIFPNLEPLQLMQITKLIEIGPFEAIELQNLLSANNARQQQEQELISTPPTVQTTNNSQIAPSVMTPQPASPPHELPSQTLQLKIVDQPPEKCVYKRNVKPAPVVQIVGNDDNVDNDGNLYVMVTLIRCDTFQEAPNLITGHKPVRVTTSKVIAFKRLKILCTSHQLNETLFCLQFSLRRYNGNEYVTLHTVTSNPICVLSHSTQLKPVLSMLPTVTEVIPLKGPPSGFTRVAVLGSNFADSPTTRVQFDEIEVMPIFHGPKTLICHTPKHPPGIVSVRVCNDAKRWSDTAGTFTYDESLPEEDEKIIVDAPFQLRLEDPKSTTSTNNAPSQQPTIPHEELFEFKEQKRDFSPLHYTAALGYVEATKKLLTLGARPETVDREGNTALHWAARAGQSAIIELLVRHCGQSRDRSLILMELRNKNGDTPLHLAVIEGHYDAVTTLIHFGSSVNPQNLDGVSPLHAAILSGHKKIAELLLNNGAYVNLPDFEGDSPLHWAVRCGNDELAQLLLDRGARLDSRNDDQETPLLLAASVCDRQLVKLLLSRGAQLDVCDKGGITPLHWAVLGDDHTTVMAILEAMSSNNYHHQTSQVHPLLTSQEKSGYTPIDLARVCGYKDMIDLLSCTQQTPSPRASTLEWQSYTCASVQDSECTVAMPSSSALSGQILCRKTKNELEMAIAHF